MTTQTLDASVETTEQTSTTEPGDHDRFAHYVKTTMIDASVMSGTVSIALCGKVWVASKSPERLPVCKPCKDIYETLKPGANDE